MKNLHPTIKLMTETGISLSKSQFHAAVNNADQVPENYFSNESNVASRRCEMWAHPSWNFILCCQKNSKKEDCYFFVPISTVIFGNFLKQEAAVEESNYEHEFEKNKFEQELTMQASSAEVLPRAESNLAKQVGATPFKKRGRPFKNKTE